MKHFYIEVLVKEGKDHVWKKVRPTGGAPYRYPVRDDAEEVARMCYPDEWRIRGGVRVVEE